MITLTSPTPVPKSFASNAGFYSLQSMLSQLSFTEEIPKEAEPSHYQRSFLIAGLLCLDNDELFYDALETCEDHDEHGRCTDKAEIRCYDNDTAGEQKNSESDGHEKDFMRSSLQNSRSRDAYVNEPQQQPHNNVISINGGHNEQYNMPIHPQSREELVYEQHQNNVLTPLPPPPPPLLPEHHALPEHQSLAPPLPQTPFTPLKSPAPPQELPLRFLRAGKGDPVEGQRRYEATLKWRKENGMDTILTDPHPNFELIKSHYPHYYHLRGRKNEPVFFEQPPKTNLQAMRDGGVTLDGLCHHYAMVTEFQWQFIEKDDLARAITVVDLEGMRMRDFVGECIEYVKRCSTFTGQHYPERAGFVYVINVPGWFAMIWSVVKPMVDEVTLKKINILKGKQQIFEALLEKIPIENIPPEYGGQSVPLGESPQEILLRDLMCHNNNLANGDCSCGGRAANPPCRFCSFRPVRSY